MRGLFWRQALDWGVANMPFYFLPFNLCVSTLVFYFFAGGARRAVTANLGLIFAGSSPFVNHLRAFRTLYNFGWTIGDASHYKLNRRQFTYELDGTEQLDALAAGKGAIVLTAHMGSYDLGAAIFSRKFKREIRMLRAPETDERSAHHLQQSLEQTGSGAVKVDYNTGDNLISFDLLKSLRQGEIVSIQGDRVPHGSAHQFAPLFGRKVAFPTGPFALAYAAEAPVYPLFIVRTGYRCYRIIARAPVLLDRSNGSRDEIIQRGVEAWAQHLEQIVTAHWHQWFAFEPILTTDGKN